MKLTVNNLKKLVKKVLRPEETSPKEKDTLEGAVKKAEEEARYNLTEELRERYACFWENRPIKEKCILYEAFGGRGMTCSPHAIFKYLLTQTEFQEYLHVWVIDDFSDNRISMEQYKDCENVKFVKFQSLEYREYLATAKYLVNNVSFPGYFTKREGQIFIDTWHGIPLKTIGFDIPSGKVSAGNTVKNFLAADYLISPNSFMTQIYKKAFKMDGLYPGTILEIGQPRNDSYFHSDREDVIRKLNQMGVKVDPDKKLILYAPTWKGSKYSSPDTSLDAYEKMIRTIEENVDTTRYQVFVKPHQIVYYHIKDTQGVTGQYIPATVDTNELLRATDILISDYSSIYFDYLVSGRPVLFFIPDLADYIGYRGLYFGIDKLPGPIAQNYEELGTLIRDADKAMEPYRERYQREAVWACPMDDGNVCKRLADVVFHGEKLEGCIKCHTVKKKKLLLYAGDFSGNEVTGSVIQMAEYLDYEKYDVTLLVEGQKEKDSSQRLSELSGQVRVLYRGQPCNGSARENACHDLLMRRKETEIPAAFYKREGKRLFGDASFDCAIDFTGKKDLFSMVLSQLPGTECHVFHGLFAEKNRIARELKEQSVVVSQKDSYYIAKSMQKNPSVITLETVSAPDTERTAYFYMCGKKGKDVIQSFSQCQEKNSCLYIMGQGKEYESLEKIISKLHLDGRVILTGWLERPFAFLNMCDYIICPKGEKESMGSLAAKTRKKKLLEDDFKTEITGEFDPELWNQKSYQELEKLIEGERNSDE